MGTKVMHHSHLINDDLAVTGRVVKQKKLSGKSLVNDSPDSKIWIGLLKTIEKFIMNPIPSPNMVSAFLLLHPLFLCSLNGVSIHLHHGIHECKF